MTGISRASTFAVHQATLREASRIQGDLFTLQDQLSSGLKSSNFKGISSQAEQFLDLETKVSRTSLYLDNNANIQTRVDSTDRALTQAISTATDLRNLILTRRNSSSVSGPGVFNAQLNDKFQELAGTLNANQEGRYLFSGTKTDTAPVDTSNFPTSTAPDDSYYRGSKQNTAARIQDGVDMTYNVRADAPGFQKIFAGMALAKSGDANLSDADLGRAYDLVSAGLQDIIAIQSTVNSNKVRIDQVNEQHESFKLYFKGLKDSIGNTDIVSASTQVALDQGILQAAFRTFSIISSLKLSDFLR